MSTILHYTSKSMLSHDIQVSYQFDIPVFGNQHDDVYEERLNSMDSILTLQYLNAIKRVILDYEKCPLPQKYIHGQNILVTSLPRGLYGVFNLIGDDIAVDADMISGFWGDDLHPSFLFGHEMGHKIAKYIPTDKLYQEIARMLEISLDGNFYTISETFADECGNIMSPCICEHGILPRPIMPSKREGIKQLILSSVYKN